MTSWQDAKRYVHANYKATDVSDSLLKLIFNTANLRSQVVFVAYDTNNVGDEWVRVNSPIGKVSEIDLVRAGTMLADRIVGGLVIYGDTVHVTNSVPLSNLDANEIVEPLERVMAIADQIEAELVGSDNY